MACRGDEHQRQEDTGRLNDVRPEVAGVSLEGDRARLASGTGDVEHDADVHDRRHDERDHARRSIDLDIAVHQVLNALVDDEAGGTRDEDRLAGGGDALGFAVAIRMLLICRSARELDANEREDRCDAVLGAVDAIREDRNAPANDADDDL